MDIKSRVMFTVNINICRNRNENRLQKQDKTGETNISSTRVAGNGTSYRSQPAQKSHQLCHRNNRRS